MLGGNQTWEACATGSIGEIVCQQSYEGWTGWSFFLVDRNAVVLRVHKQLLEDLVQDAVMRDRSLSTSYHRVFRSFYYYI